ncbi:MAG: M48 family metallopeptidase [Alphaproteobacteria bacterium]
MKPTDIYGHIANNNRKIAGLVLLFPVALALFIYAFFFLLAVIGETPFEQALQESNEIFICVVPIVLGLCAILTLLSFGFGDKMMLGFAGAKICPDNKEHLQVYRAVENLALKAGIPTPKVYLIPDESLNAFATGYSPKNASIALTTGIVKKLEPIELEAVISHEMGHIINRDIRLNMFIITGIGVIGILGEILIRSASNNRSSNKKENAGGLFIMVGLALLLFRYLVAPFIHMALSRSQEFQADATGAYLTRHPTALADALKKIAVNPRVKSLDSSSQMACACIYNPMKKIGGLLDTHPPIQERIERLNKMV